MPQQCRWTCSPTRPSNERTPENRHVNSKRNTPSFIGVKILTGEIVVHGSGKTSHQVRDPVCLDLLRNTRQMTNPGTILIIPSLDSRGVGPRKVGARNAAETHSRGLQRQSKPFFARGELNDTVSQIWWSETSSFQN